MSHLIFTLDFHEMVRGKLEKNGNCTINYDPLRLAKDMEGYVHGSPAFEFTAYVQFKPEGSVNVPLTSDTGILDNPVVMNNGVGSTLTGHFMIPADAEEVITWIALKNDKAEEFYDSDFGNNFHFRIIDEDIQVTKAVVENNKTSGMVKFTLSATSTTAIESVIVRYRITNGPDPETEIAVYSPKPKAKKTDYPGPPVRLK